MKKTILYLIPLLLISFILMQLFFKNNVSDGEKAPDFKATLIDGSPFQLSSLQGKYVLLDFWGSWCPPCRKSHPQLVALHKKFPDKLTIVTIALEKDNKRWKNAAQKDGFTWKNQIVEQHKIILLSEIARTYGVSEIPAKFLISPEGLLLPEKSFEAIEQLLQKK